MQKSSVASVAFAVPRGAADCHHHIYDARFPSAASASLTPADASVEEYLQLRERLGLQRSVIVQPSTYGFDNRLLLASLRMLGAGSRGVAVISPKVSDDELDLLHRAGVRGARVNLMLAVGMTSDMIEPITRRIAARGWHLQVAATGDQIVANRRVLGNLSIPVVYDHMGLLPAPRPLEHEGFGFLCEQLASGRAWVKLSGVCNLSVSGRPNYADYSAVGRRLANEFPDRILWGSDWPHVFGHFKEPPDDAELLNLFSTWCNDDGVIRQALVDNPVEVYGF